MLYKKPNLELEFYCLHPEVKALLLGLDAWLKEQSWPEVFLTHCIRTPQEQEDLYWLSIQTDNPGMTERAARAKARARPTWHLYACAADLRNSQYDRNQKAKIMSWLRTGRDLKKFELLDHDVGAGRHIHVGIRDEDFKRKYAERTK